MSQLTTHVLDTAKGKPGKGIKIVLEQKKENDDFIELAEGVTNDDGRIPNLLPKDKVLEFGIYKMTFDTESYFKSNDTKGFYPYVSIVFEINSTEHYHIPLLISPYGYSTYRGS